MKKTLSVFSFLLLIIVIASHGQTEQEFKTTPKSVIGYIEYIPPDYENNNFDYPLVIFLHGLGQRGPNSTDPKVLETGYHHLVSYGPARYVKNGTQFPFLLVTPALKSNYGDWPSWYVMEVIEHVRTYLRVDPKRIYLTGSSLGGGGTWVTAQDYPDYLAAIAPVAGSRNSVGKACDIARSNLPVWAFHGDKDNVVPLGRSVNMVNAINACNPGVKARMTIYEGLGHNAHNYAYDLGEKYHSPDLYTWLLSWENDHGNKIPAADAGPDITTSVGSTIVINGKGSDSDGSISNYSWVKLKGPDATLTGRTSKDVSISGLEKGTYVFRLTVRDNDGAIASDDVTVVVDGSGNAAPTVNAGADKTITLPTNSVEITGTASDPDGKIASYTWTKVSGGNATLSGATTTKLTASELEAGNYTFRLTVKDNGGASKSDDVKVFVNKAPTVNAGADVTQTLPQNSTTLKGVASDSDGSIKSYAWTKVSGPSLQMSGANGTELAITNLVEGKYLLRLTVTDNSNASAFDEVTVTVLPAAPNNKAPTANAGANKVITLPQNSTTLSGSGSDSDGKIASYQWTKVSGGTAAMNGATTANLALSDLQAGSYTFRLTVKDDGGASSSDDVVVFVNTAPKVNAGADVAFNLPKNSTTLKGVATDSDGSIKSYAWTKVSGPDLQMSGASGADLTISNLIEGKYVLRLTVTDNNNASAFDEVTVTVRASVPGNNAPTANAGADIVITLPKNSITLSGSGTDSDGSVASFQWTKVSGGAATLADAANASTSASGLVAGVYTFRLTVTDDRGSIASDEVVVTVNRPPVANAGPDRVISLPMNRLKITGSATDPDGQVSSYKWTKISGGTAALSGTGTASLDVSDLEAGEYVFRLQVKDNNDGVHTDDVKVRVNAPPIANAGADKKVIQSAAALEVKGSGSDTDGSVVAYAWKKISGATVSLARANTASVSLTGLAVGVYVFELTVTDNDGATHSDQVKITVAANQLPVANAGPDQVINVPENSVVLQGSGSDPDGKVVEYLWQKVSGKAGVISDPASAHATITGLTSGAYVFSLTVTDNSGGTHTSTVKVKVNKAPVANAGEDMLVHLPKSTIELTGTATDADGSIASVRWTKVSGAAVSLSGDKTNTITVDNLKSGIYIFRFTVVDNDGARHTDDVQVVVNTPPVVDAGADVYLKLPENSVHLQGTAKDIDGEISRWRWRKTSGGGMVYKGQTTSNFELSDLQVGTYVFSLEVIDNHGAKSVDNVTVVVHAANEAPVADAGPDHLLVLPVDSLTIVGSGSDHEEGALSFEWTQFSGVPATLTNVYEPALHVSGLEQGEYTFRLTVTDAEGATHSDDVMVTVEAATVPEEVLGNPMQISGCAECVYYIWGQNLQQLHTGPWTDDMYERVFSTAGLYYFNVRRGGETIRRGKVFRYDR